VSAAVANPLLGIMCSAVIQNVPANYCPYTQRYMLQFLDMQGDSKLLQRTWDEKAQTQDI